MILQKSTIAGGVLCLAIGFIAGGAHASFDMRQRLAAQAQMNRDDVALLNENNKELSDLAGVAVAWMGRAQSCEAKFHTITVLDEYKPAVSLPVLHGAFTVELGSAGNPAGGLAPAWAIPAQVEPYSALPGAMYRWIDAKTGEAKGTFPAESPEGAQ